MASSVATPLERQLGHTAGMTEMASTGQARQHIDHHSVRPESRHRRRGSRWRLPSMRREPICPPTCRAIQTYREELNPPDFTIMILGLTSDKYGPDKMYDEASPSCSQRVTAQIPGRRAGHCRGWRVAVRAGGRKSHTIGRLWTYHGEFAVRAEPAERRPGTGQISRW